MFNNLGSRQPKKWKSAELLLNLLLEVCDGEIISFVNLNEIHMTKPVLATKATVGFKAITETKDEGKSQVDKD